MRAHEFMNEDITWRELHTVERFADALWGELGIAVEFTRHFMDRVNDERNGEPITVEELIALFKKEYEANGKKVAHMRPDSEAVLKDLFTSINIPFVIKNVGRDEKEIVAKTVMRKKDFKTRTPEFKVK